MQSVKLYMRQIGVASQEANIKGVAEVEEEIEFKFTSAGYNLHTALYLGATDANSLGYRVLCLFVKDDAPTARKTLKDA